MEAEVASLKQQKSIYKSQEREVKKEVIEFIRKAVTRKNRDKLNSLKAQIEENQKIIDNLTGEVEKLRIKSDKQVGTCSRDTTGRDISCSRKYKRTTS